LLESLTWTGWGTPTARGAGIPETDNCTPSCAAGAYTGYRATVILNDPVANGTATQAYVKVVVNAPGAPFMPETFKTDLVP